MIHRIGRKKYKCFAFDLESHNDSESIAKKDFVRHFVFWESEMVIDNRFFEGRFNGGGGLRFFRRAFHCGFYRRQQTFFFHALVSKPVG